MRRKRTQTGGRRCSRAKRRKTQPAPQWSTSFPREVVGSVLQFVPSCHTRPILTTHATLPLLALQWLPFTSFKHAGSETQFRRLLANPNASDAVLNDVLYYASARKMHSLLAQLFHHRRITNTMLQHLLRLACQCKHMGTMVTLLSPCLATRVTPSQADLLAAAVKKNNVAVVRLLMADDRVAVPPDLLAYPAQCGRVAMVRFLITQPNIDVNYGRHSALLAAMLNGHTHVVDLLIAHSTGFAARWLISTAIGIPNAMIRHRMLCHFFTVNRVTMAYLAQNKGVFTFLTNAMTTFSKRTTRVS